MQDNNNLSKELYTLQLLQQSLPHLKQPVSEISKFLELLIIWIQIHWFNICGNNIL